MIFELGINSQLKTGFRRVESQALISEDHLLRDVGFLVALERLVVHPFARTSNLTK